MNHQSKKFLQLQQLEHQQNRNYSGQQSSGQRHYGANLILSRYSNGQPRFALGPHCKLYFKIDYVFIFALLLLTGLLVFLIITMKQHLSVFWLGVLIVCGVLFFFSYLNIGLSIPGFASRAEQPSQQEKLNPRYCKPCKVVRANKVYHCYDCDVCIEEYDHHCPWIGKCVGKNNLSSFYFFLIMIFGTLLMCFVATLASNISQQNNKNLKTNDSDSNQLKVKS